MPCALGDALLPTATVLSDSIYMTSTLNLTSGPITAEEALVLLSRHRRIAPATFRACLLHSEDLVRRTALLRLTRMRRMPPEVVEPAMEATSKATRRQGLLWSSWLDDLSRALTGATGREQWRHDASHRLLARQLGHVRRALRDDHSGQATAGLLTYHSELLLREVVMHSPSLRLEDVIALLQRMTPFGRYSLQRHLLENERLAPEVAAFLATDVIVRFIRTSLASADGARACLHDLERLRRIGPMRLPFELVARLAISAERRRSRSRGDGALPARLSALAAALILDCGAGQASCNPKHFASALMCSDERVRSAVLMVA